MRGEYLTADANGTILRAGRGRGVALLPGRDPAAPNTVTLGSYPVTVVRADGKRIPIVGPHAYYWGGDDAQAFRIENCTAGESWCVLTFDAPEDGVRVGGRTRVAELRQNDSTAVATAAPTLATEGFALRPGDRVVQYTFDGGNQNVDLYVRTLSGNWKLAERLHDVAAGDTMPHIVTRTVSGALGRLYLRAGAAGVTCGIDAEREAG